MATTVTLYNALPTLGEAEERFASRERMFAAVRSLLAEYGFVFGLCLIRAHCKLADDEIMVGRGNISQPEKASALVECYPERWLSSGEPYEFTTRPTTSPPAPLIDAFHQLTSHVEVLGLYHIGNEGQDKPGKMVEYTEGRKNILRPFTDADRAHTATQTETAWNLGSLDPVTLACESIIICDSRTTRSGGVHKGMFEFSVLQPHALIKASMQARSQQSTKKNEIQG